MKNSDIRNQLENYKIHRKLTRDLLLSLILEQLSVKQFSVSGAFGKQFRHLIDIERCYVESLETGFLKFFRSSIDHSIENDKKRLIQEMDSEDGKLVQIFGSIQWEKANDKTVDCSQAVKYLGYNNKLASKVQILSWITEHEIFHEGELALYVRNENLKFPGSWINWGLK